MSLVRVLLAGDDEAERQWLCFALRPLPCVVVQVRGGTELELERQLCGAEHFDLIISDVCTAGPSGLEAAARARRAGLTTPIIFMTSSGDDAVKATVDTLRDAVLVTRPIEAEDLLGLVRHWLAFGSGGCR
jgi:CheY-like chemotaxis protein